MKNILGLIILTLFFSCKTRKCCQSEWSLNYSIDSIPFNNFILHFKTGELQFFQYPNHIDLEVLLKSHYESNYADCNKSFEDWKMKIDHIDTIQFNVPYCQLDSI